MFADGFEGLKAACALIDAGLGVEGTGYLAGEDFVVTCEHVIRGAKKGDPVNVHLGGKVLPATLTDFDEQTDSAYLKLVEKYQARSRLFVWLASAVGRPFGTDTATRASRKARRCR